MSKNRLLVLIILTFFSLLSAKEWTILIYMAADNGLHNDALADIEEMEKSQFGSHANIIVQFDGAEGTNLSGTYRYKIGHHPQEGIQSKRIANLGDLDSGSYLTLKSFVDWGFRRYKSDKKALIMWSHGDGWTKQSADRGIAPDNTSRNFISMSEHQMQMALADNPVDILIYDACNMQTVENLHELAGSADYIIGSEATIPTTGFPYIQLFDYWQEAESIETLVTNIPQIYLDAYKPGSIYNPGQYLDRITCSTAKMSEWEPFVSQLSAYLHKWSSQTHLFEEFREDVHEFGMRSNDVDLRELLQTLSLESNNSELQADSSNLYELMSEVFISYGSASYDNKVGMATIWFPRYVFQFSNNWGIYRNLHFAKLGIAQFLNQYLAPDEIPPFPFVITKALVLNETIYLEWENHYDPDPLTYHLNFNYENGESEVVTLENIGHYEQVVPSSGEIFIVAEDLAGNRTKTAKQQFVLTYDYGEIYFAPHPIKDLEQGRLIIYIKDSAGKSAEINIYNISGKRVASQKITFSPNNDEQKIPLNTIISSRPSSGIYICTVKVDNKLFKTKLVVQY